MTIFKDVAEFHEKILDLKKLEHASLLTPEMMLERFRFLCEETNEFYTASVQGDMVKAVDGLLDTIYVAAGTLWLMGVPEQACWDLVQMANMSKVRGVTSRGNAVDAVKPEGWVAPEAGMAAVLLAQIDNDAPWD